MQVIKKYRNNQIDRYQKCIYIDVGKGGGVKPYPGCLELYIKLDLRWKIIHPIQIQNPPPIQDCPCVTAE